MVKIIKCVLVILSAIVLIANGTEVGPGAITIGGSPVSNNNNNNNNGVAGGGGAGTMGGAGAGTGGTTKSVGTAGTGANTGTTKSVGTAGTGATGVGGAGTGVGGAGTGVGGAGAAGVGGTGATGTGIGGTGVGTTTKDLGAGASTTTLDGLSATPSATDTKKTETKTDSTPTKTSKSKEKKKSFFSSTFFYVILGIFGFIIALLGYFYYVGSKDEREEEMRNLENGGNKTNNYGVTQTVEINKGVSLYDDKPSYGETASNPFADSNKVDETDPYNTDYNTAYNTAYNTNYDSPAVSYQNPSLMAAPAPSNPFDSPNLDAMEDNKNMKDMSNGFPDSLPQPSVVKLTEIEKPQQGNTVPTLRKNNEDDDILKPSMVRMTNIETPVPSNTIPTDKDISIGDDILKPSMVTLTEIQTPKESSFNNGAEKEKENEEEPKKAVVNMIDLKTPSSNEALNASNLLTPSIMITSTDGKTETANTGANEQEEIPEEYSEMPEPRPFRAIHAYEPQIDDELRLEVDNEIDVLYEYDDGWCWAINKTTDEQGACPMLCLISIKEEATGEREWEKEMDVMKVPGRRESMLSNSFDPSRLSLLKSK